ncbi:methyl-viologen-reducing hydrogenase, delta subunit/4Fe-4S dicluster domain [Longilinea arvoryzae]|uniref:Methyl-viologen-reducing hydrogenase, delta subunit/4Fe-4S dicluster domain n=1 Tax=Longilinea arvoryzae TaxID=360412 RepID=A0A0S7BHK1_9CHLR|nr:hydrogenase iron-sulfur subunit [Longilinea arvoryzae]GAP13704.1 methyl-viologen-reducing hydrogenase, delta subunit/4Fe-4S dicluster domain [Longilinea arvoryzae]
MAEEELVSQSAAPEPPRVGVILCECGAILSGRLDPEALQRQTAALPGVVYVHHEAFPCSRDGQERLRRAIREQNLERVLIAGCAPRLVEKLFRNAVREAGLDPGYLMVSNIRDATQFFEDDPQAALRKASSIIEMGAARLGTTQAALPRYGKVQRSALVIGGGLRGVSVGLALAEKDIPVTLLILKEDEREDDAQGLARERLQAAQNHPRIRLLEDGRLISVRGHPGDYEVEVDSGGQTTSIAAGAIIVANASRPKALGSGHWFDRARVKTQAEFGGELKAAAQRGEGLGLKDVVFILCAEESQLSHCSRVCCNIGLQQAIRVKQLDPEANVTVLFRELYLSGIGGSQEAELVQARRLGVTFFRYGQKAAPVIGDKTIDIQDILTREPVRIPYDQAVLSMPLVPAESTRMLSTLLGLPLDEYGFLAEPRIRLRPGSYADPGLYVLGSAQQPADTAEALFQAYLTGARALRFLNQDAIRVDSPIAEIDAGLCTGCGNCPQVCPANAVHLERRDGILSLSTIDELLCIGCGNCVVVCPVKAIRLPGWDNLEIPAQITAALDEAHFEPGQSKLLVLACEWSAYGAAESAGHRKITFPENARILRMNCSARFDPFHILWAFLNGADGVLLGACKPGECHYGMGNLYARERVEMLHAELAQHGIDPRRLRLEFFSVQDGEKFSAVLEEFRRQIDTEMADRGQMPTGVHMPVISR